MSPVPPEVSSLVERFTRNRESYKNPAYNETQVRREFIDPLFEALGWDVDNEQGFAEAYKDVIHEDAIKIGGATKAPDYCFRIGGTRKFFLEAKKPAVPLKDAIEPAFQLRRYAWSAKLPLSILTDFEELAVYDCRVRPHKNDKPSQARTMYLQYTEYAERWDELAAVFSRDAVLKGSFDKYAESGRRKRGTAEVDAEFLREIEGWRDAIARNFALRNKGLSVRELNFAVQRTIDRLIFLRMCEDRGIEPYGQLQALLNGAAVYARLGELFRRADERYNSSLFYFTPERGREPADELTLALKLDDRVLKEIIGGLYYPESPYEFYVLPPEILGHVYEQFLGKVIRLTRGGQAKVEEKPEVRKAGGVYYTPTYIVDYIVKHTVGKLLEERVPGFGARDSDGQASDSGGAPNGDQALSRSGGVAAGDGPGGSGLSADQGPAQRGTLRTQQPDATLGGLDPGQHSRGPRPPAPGRLRSPPVGGEGFAGRTGNAPDAGGSAGLPEAGGRARNMGAGPARRPAPQRAHRRAQKKTRAPGPKPLAPVSRLRILDPACGSGSFLLGAYQHLLDWHRDWYVSQVEGRAGVSPAGARQHTDRIYQGAGGQWRLTIQEKKRILLNNIYGVDIDPQAVEVTKLSLLLKVLEGESAETIGSNLRLFHERALPDLSDNIKCGNSLIGPDFYEGRQLSMFDEEERLRINAFDWHAEFPQVFGTRAPGPGTGTPDPESRTPDPSSGFDAVIGNPPYIRMEAFKELKDYLRHKYLVHDERTDLYVYFIEREHEVLREGGRFGMIVSNKFLRANYGRKVRELLSRTANIERIVDLAGLPVFPGATVRTIVLLTSKCIGDTPVTYCPPPEKDPFVTLQGGSQDLEGVASPGAYEVPQGALTPEGWRLNRPERAAILEQLGARGAPLATRITPRICRGVVSGLTDAFVISPEQRRNILARDPAAKAIIRPFLQGRNIRRYSVQPSGDYLIYTYHGVDMSPYPTVIEHPRQFKKRLERRATKQAWYELQQPQYGYKGFLESPKIVFPDIATECRFALDTGGHFGANTVYFIPSDDLFLLGLLNSKLAYFHFRET